MGCLIKVLGPLAALVAVLLFPAEVRHDPAPPRRDAALPRPAAPRPESPSVPGTPLRVPVLMYHVIGDGPGGLFVRREDFAAQLDALARNGYHTITLERLYAAMRGQTGLPSRPVVISFDDDYPTHYEAAFPLLAEHGFTGVFFIISDYIGRAGHLTWAQLREMRDAGMEIGCHTASHPELPGLSTSPKGLWRETAGARRALETHLGRPVRFFCYPVGHYNARVVAAVRSAGFLGAFTTHPGWVEPRDPTLEWPRVRINRSDTLAGFSARLGMPASPQEGLRKTAAGSLPAMTHAGTWPFAGAVIRALLLHRD